MLLSLSVLISTSAVSLWHCFPLFTFSTVNLSARRLWPWSFKQQHKTWEGQCSSIVGSRYIFYVLKDRPEVIHKAHADLLPWTHGATSHQMELQLGGSARLNLYGAIFESRESSPLWFCCDSIPEEYASGLSDTSVWWASGAYWIPGCYAWKLQMKAQTKPTHSPVEDLIRFFFYGFDLHSLA